MNLTVPLISTSEDKILRVAEGRAEAGVGAGVGVGAAAGSGARVSGRGEWDAEDSACSWPM